MKVIILSHLGDADTRLEGYALGVERTGPKILAGRAVPADPAVRSASARPATTRRTRPRESNANDPCCPTIKTPRLLYSRLNYERLACPGFRPSCLGRIAGCSAAGRSAGRSPDRPHRRHQGEGLDGRDDGRVLTAAGVGRGSIPRRTCIAWKSGSRSTAGPRHRTELVELVDRGAATPPISSSRRPAPRTAGHVLRDHHGDGPAPLRPPTGRARSCSRSAWAAGSIDQRRPPLGLDHHQHLVRPHPAARQHAGRDRRRRRPDLKRTPAVSGVRGGEARESIRRVAAQRGVPCTSWARTRFRDDPARATVDPAHALPGRDLDLADRLGDSEAAAARPAPGPQCGGRPGGPRRTGQASPDWPSDRDDVARGFANLGGRPGRGRRAIGRSSSSTGAQRRLGVALAETLRPCFPPALGP